MITFSLHSLVQYIKSMEDYQTFHKPILKHCTKGSHPLLGKFLILSVGKVLMIYNHYIPVTNSIILLALNLFLKPVEMYQCLNI